jgi:hypothetical protein
VEVNALGGAGVALVLGGRFLDVVQREEPRAGIETSAQLSKSGLAVRPELPIPAIQQLEGVKDAFPLDGPNR